MSNLETGCWGPTDAQVYTSYASIARNLKKWRQIQTWTTVASYLRCAELHRLAVGPGCSSFTHGCQLSCPLLSNLGWVKWLNRLRCTLNLILQIHTITMWFPPCHNAAPASLQHVLDVDKKILDEVVVATKPKCPDSKDTYLTYLS